MDGEMADMDDDDRLFDCAGRMLGGGGEQFLYESLINGVSSWWSSELAMLRSGRAAMASIAAETGIPLPSVNGEAIELIWFDDFSSGTIMQLYG